MSDSDSDDDGSIFQELTEADGVCQNCFNRTHTILENWLPSFIRDKETESTKAIQRDKWISINSETFLEPNQDPDTTEQPLKRVCTCGCFSRKMKVRPLKKGRMIEYTHNLVDRLEEEDIEFDEDLLYDEIRRMKEDPDFLKSDDYIFEEAVRTATEINYREYKQESNS